MLSTSDVIPPGQPGQPGQIGQTDPIADVAKDVRNVSEGEWVGPTPRGLRTLAAELCALPATLWRYRDLIQTCVGRELRARFRGSWLGLGWPLIQPLLLFAVYGFLFSEILGMRLPVEAGASGGASAYGRYLFLGALVWTSFGEALGRAVGCIVEQRTVVQKLAFPSQLLPIQVVLAQTVLLLAGVGVYLGAAALFTDWPLPSGAALLRLPLLLMLQLGFLCGLALGLSALNVHVRDTAHATGVLLTVLMFATPVFWIPAPELLPGIEEWMWLVDANPMHHLMNAWRGLLMGGQPALCFTASVDMSLIALLPWSICSLLFGGALFLRLKPDLGDLV